MITKTELLAGLLNVYYNLLVNCNDLKISETFVRNSWRHCSLIITILTMKFYLENGFDVIVGKV